MNPEMKALLRRRAQVVKAARSDLLTYVRLLHPTPDHPDDPDQSLYDVGKPHKVIAQELQAIATQTRRQRGKRLIIVVPPRHGKTELVTKSLVPWYIGRSPQRSVIVATYSDTFALDLGRGIRANIEHPATAQVFPNLHLDPDARSASRMETSKRGAISVVGRGSAITGRGGDLLIVDDPLKDRKEADSQAIRDSLWKWFNQVFLTRLMTDSGSVIIVMTRWHEDDLVGRLTDPRNPYYSAREAAHWKVVHLKAVSDEGDPLKRPPGRALWPKRFGIQYLRRMQGQDSRGFNALYQGEPSAAGGTFFLDYSLIQYDRQDLPEQDQLRWYMSGDLAVSTKQDADKTVLGLVGIDSYGQLWVHPQLTWKRISTDQLVETALWLVEKYRPLFWFAERGVIQKSIGPFLRKRMIEKQVFVSIREFTPIQDKMARAQSIHGRIEQGLVRFPGFAPWWSDAKHELTSFPYGSNDDFVDFLSLVGLGLDALTPAERRDGPLKLHDDNRPAFGTLGWVKERSREQYARSQRPRAQGW